MRSPQTDQAAALLEALLDSTDDAVLTTDLNGVITSWTPGAERIYGTPAEEIVGHLLTEFIAGEKRGDVAEILQKVSAG